MKHTAQAGMSCAAAGSDTMQRLGALVLGASLAAAVPEQPRCAHPRLANCPGVSSFLSARVAQGVRVAVPGGARGASTGKADAPTP